MSDLADDSDGEHRRKRIRQACLNCSDEASDLIVTTISSKFMGLEDRLSKIEDTLQRLEPLLSSLAVP
ncbi:hypothetical protein CEP53_008472 [Fusarium sp. AF-6]|nr:hypothetical protein CEP53_008472 [Fusarium sp. AF-6]